MGVIEWIAEQELAVARDAMARGAEGIDHYLRKAASDWKARHYLKDDYSGRYPIELLQNANDAISTSGARGRVRFHLSDHALLVADTGGGFQENNVRGILDVGQSSKSLGEVVGYKGIGFNAVAEISGRPEFYSVRESFRLDPDYVRRQLEAVFETDLSNRHLPAQLIPAPVRTGGPDSGLIDELIRSGFTTVIRMPLDALVSRSTVEAQLLESLDPNSLVFLPALEELAVTGTDSDCSWHVRREESDHGEVVIITGDDDESVWQLFCRRVEIEPSLTAALGDDWVTRSTSKVEVAVPLDAQADPAISGPYPLHAYFPSEEQTGLGVICSADFALEPARKRLQPGTHADGYNRYLLSEAVDLIANTIAPLLARRCQQPSRVIELFAPRGEATGAGAILRGSLDEALRDAAFVPNAANSFLTPTQASLLPPRAPDPFQFHRHLSEEALGSLVHPAIDHSPACHAYLTDLGSGHRSWSDSIGGLRTPEEPEVSDYYRLLNRCAEVHEQPSLPWAERQEISKALRQQRCLRTTDGSWVRCGENVFLAPAEIPPASSLYSIVDLPRDVDLEALLEILKIRQWSLRLVQPAVFKVLCNRTASPSERSDALNLAHRIFSPQGLGAGLETPPGGVLVPVRHSGSEEVLAPASQVYFGSEWTGEPRLEKLLSKAGTGQFLESPNRLGFDDRGFWQWLGVSDRLRLDVVHATTGLRWPRVGDEFGSHCSSELWAEWKESASTRDAAECPRSHSRSQSLVQSARLPELEAIAASADREALVDLWFEIAGSWDDLLARPDHANATFKCTHGSCQVGARPRSCPSLFNFAIENLEWVPAEVDGRPVLRRPSECWDRLPAGRHRLGRILPQIDRKLLSGSGWDLARRLGVIHDDDPPVEALCDVLRALKERHSNHPELAGETFQSAEWIVRLLDRRLAETEVESVSGLIDLPLPAFVGRERAFASGPLVHERPSLVARLLFDRPVLSVSSLRNSSVRILGLHRDTSLDLRERIEERGPNRQWTEELQRSLAVKLSEVAALAVHAAASPEPRILDRLRSLTLSACEGFDLVFAVGDRQETDRDPMPTYLLKADGGSRGQSSSGAIVYISCDDDGRPKNLYGLGAQLASYLGVRETLGDAIGTVLTGDTTQVQSLFESKDVDRSEVERLADILAMPLLPDEGSLVPDEPDPSQRPSDGTDRVAPPPKTDHHVSPAAQPETVPAETVRAIGPLTEDAVGRSVPAREADRDLPSAWDGLRFESLRLAESPAISEADRQSPSRQRLEVSGSSTRGESLGHTTGTRASAGDEVEIGRRGEELAFQLERKRAAALGFDPDQVIWHSRNVPTALYDIRGVADDGSIRYLEVKSTDQSDPATPFMMSRGEVEFARANRDAYALIRVTNALSSSPRIGEVPDLQSLLSVESSYLQPTEYRVSLRLSFSDRD